MLKMYHRHAETGSSAAYWEMFGAGSTLADHARFCEIDPLRPLFRRFLRPGSVMLEGGCGRGQYVAYYSARGATVVGLDFAREWLKAARAEIPSLRLCAGDVFALPFSDRAFDLYYSGGVVEHFEGGADRALAEARRVLKPDGVLLMSVPYFSPMRRALSALGRRDWRRVTRSHVEDTPDANLRFYQYAYTVPEFTRLLAAAGFRVRETQGYAVIWGLYDVRAIERIAASIQRRRRPAPSRAPGRDRASAGTAVPARRPTWLKRLLVAEDDTVPGAGWLVKAARRTCANMMMYVCEPCASPEAA